MRRLRSLRARLLAATALIAVGAVGVTAWLTSRGTTDRLRDDVEQSFVANGTIYEKLLGYAYEHSDWRDVDELVRRLAAETNRRIVLTTEKGRLIVDSAALDGDDPPPLPRRPVAVVDPDNPVSVGFEEAVFEGPLEPDGEGSNPYTAEELEQFREVAEQGSQCLDESGVPNQVVTYEDGSSDVVLLNQDDAAAQQAFDRCVDVESLYPSGLDTMSDAEIAEMIELDGLLRQCLEDRGIAIYTQQIDGIPSTWVVDETDPAATEAYTECEAEANEAVYGEYTDPAHFAEPVRLYLSSSDSVGLAVLDAGRGPMLVAAVLVASLAVAVTFVVSRRLLRPVGALTGAAQRMAAGDLSHRVSVRGRDELAGLAHSFNSMADAIAANEEQRKRMVNDVAHELRTPLANIRGYVEAALDGVTLADDKLLGSLHEDAVLLQRLVDDLQTLALAEAGRLTLHLEPTDVGELAATVVNGHARQAEAAGLALLLDADDAGEGRSGDAPAPPPLLVNGDPGRLRQALGNLVSNALRYSKVGDRVIVRVRQDGMHAVVQVVDTGIGIAAHDLPHVFDRFYRADRSRTRDTGGSGLGLAITSELIAAHLGTVHGTSVEGEGSTFTVRLPLRS